MTESFSIELVDVLEYLRGGGSSSSLNRI